jgi:hypothetical protein
MTSFRIIIPFYEKLEPPSNNLSIAFARAVQVINLVNCCKNAAISAVCVEEMLPDSLNGKTISGFQWQPSGIRENPCFP